MNSLGRKTGLAGAHSKLRDSFTAVPPSSDARGLERRAFSSPDSLAGRPTAGSFHELDWNVSLVRSPPLPRLVRPLEDDRELPCVRVFCCVCRCRPA